MRIGLHPPASILRRNPRAWESSSPLQPNPITL